MSVPHLQKSNPKRGYMLIPLSARGKKPLSCVTSERRRTQERTRWLKGGVPVAEPKRHRDVHRNARTEHRYRSTSTATSTRLLGQKPRWLLTLSGFHGPRQSALQRDSPFQSGVCDALRCAARNGPPSATTTMGLAEEGPRSYDNSSHFTTCCVTLCPQIYGPPAPLPSSTCGMAGARPLRALG